MDNIALEFKDVTGKGFGFKLKNVSMTLERTEQEKPHCLIIF